MLKTSANIGIIIVDCCNLLRAQKTLDFCQSQMEFNDVQLLSSIPDEGVTIIPPIRSKEEYSAFMIRDLAKYVKTDFVLIVQYDGFILNADAWDDQYLNYDYIGAPWVHREKNVGNGGFSLRSRKLIEFVSGLNLDAFHPEDVVIGRGLCDLLVSNGFKFAPENLAAKFSIEGNRKFGKVWNGQFGFHDHKETNIKNHPSYFKFTWLH